MHDSLTTSQMWILTDGKVSHGVTVKLKISTRALRLSNVASTSVPGTSPRPVFFLKWSSNTS